MLLCILCSTVPASAQFSPEQQHYVDSLYLEIDTLQDDVERIKALFDLDNFMYYYDDSTSLVLCTKIIDLCEKNLNRKDLSPDELDFLNWSYARAPINMGLVFQYQGRYDTALVLQDSGRARSARIDDLEGVAMAKNNTALIYFDQGNHDLAIQNFMSALKTAEKLDNTLGMILTHSSIGEVYLQQKEYEKALEHFEIGRELAAGSNDDFSLSGIYNNLGEAYLMQKRFAEAMKIFLQKQALDERIDNIQGQGTVADNIGQIWVGRGDSAKSAGNEPFAVDCYQNAVDYFQSAIRNRENIEYLEGLAISYNNLGGAYRRLGNDMEAVIQGNKGLEIAEQYGFVKEIRNISDNLFRSYQRLGNSAAALTALLRYHEMDDSLASVANQKEILRQEYRYQYEKDTLAKRIQFEQEKKMDKLAHDAELKEAALQRYLMAGGIVFLLALGGTAFLGYRRKKKDNQVISEQKQLVEHAFAELDEKNTEILDSIAYAKRIQSAILPPSRLVKEYLKNSFILYKPKDIVAGDFYWMETAGEKIIFAAADCTGHGVPGAMVSVVCNNGLNRSVREHKFTKPGQILDKTREIVIQEFEKSEEEVKDGMDIALCSLEGLKLEYAGANNPLWIVRKGEIPNETRLSPKTKLEVTGDYTFMEVKADKQPIGKYVDPLPYTTHELQLQKGDTLYIFSDGYVDQFGGEKGKKFKPANFRKLLISIQSESMDRQKQLLDEAFESWRGDLEQIDDVCIIGVRV